MDYLFQVSITRPNKKRTYVSSIEEMKKALAGSKYKLVEEQTKADDMTWIDARTKREAERLMNLKTGGLTLPSGYEMEVPTY